MINKNTTKQDKTRQEQDGQDKTRWLEDTTKTRQSQDIHNRIVKQKGYRSAMKDFADDAKGHNPTFGPDNEKIPRVELR